ncbi:hypothetical protein [Dysgonomonas macrotermitis]|nr:hypothetical protein [Dysgonomonas macrotermitis]
MKKVKLTCLLVLGLLSFTVQGQQKNTPAKLNASKIIRLSNSVIDLSNDANQALSSYTDMVSAADGNVSTLKRNNALKPTYLNYKIYEPDQRKKTEYDQASKAAPAFDEKTELLQLMSLVDSHMADVVRNSEALSSYFYKQEYQSDNDFSKYPALKDSTEASIARAMVIWRKASALAATTGDKAELLLLKDSKIAEFVIPMKSDLITLQSVFTKVTDLETDFPALETDVTALKASIEVNKDISNKDLKKLSDLYYKDAYETFYRKCAEAADYLAKLTILLKQGSDDEQRMSGLFGYARVSYRNAIEQYNTFVSQ